MRALLSAKFTEDSNTEILDKIMSSFVYDIGVICQEDIKQMLLKCEKCLINYYERPFVFRKKRTISISDVDQLAHVQNNFFFE